MTQVAAQDVASGVVGNPHDATWNAQALPESVIEEIIRRVIAQMSEKAVQEIAWEVVPDLAELLIRKQLAQKTDQ
jgi:histone H3/H4